MTVPLAYRWSGTGMEVLPRFQKEADTEFVIGEIYRLTHIEDRSSKSHAHYFATIQEAWANLPEEIAELYPTPERLRKHLLIRAGYSNSQVFVCGSEAEARRMAAFIRPIDEFSIVEAKKRVVTRWTAKSQSTRAMGAKDFQDSKQKVLDLLADLIGTSRKSLETNAAKAQA